MIDLDHFKLINDQFGHDAGDAVLVEVARAIRGALRPDDFCARMGGEEFCVLLADIDTDAELVEVTERVRQAIELVRPAAFPAVNVTASVGALRVPTGLPVAGRAALGRPGALPRQGRRPKPRPARRVSYISHRSLSEVQTLTGRRFMPLAASHVSRSSFSALNIAGEGTLPLSASSSAGRNVRNGRSMAMTSTFQQENAAGWLKGMGRLADDPDGI